jgi:hypothetical protein
MNQNDHDWLFFHPIMAYLYRITFSEISQLYFIMTKLLSKSNIQFAIFTSLCESLVLLVKAHCEYYSQIPFLPWYHRSEPVEYFFSITHQLNSDFDFADLIQILPKISQYTKALRSKKLFFDQEKTVRQDKYYLNLLITQFII